MKSRIVVFLTALLAVTQAWASTWTVTNSGSTFTITRSSSSGTERVNYRTVNLSAYAGQHYTAKSGELTFTSGVTSQTVTVSETTPGTNNYKYQNGTTRSYRFEVLDQGGFRLAYRDRSITTGTEVSTYQFENKKIQVGATETKVTDSGYDQSFRRITDGEYYLNKSVTKDYMSMINAELRMTFEFEAKESDDGYQYVQILVDNISTNDTGAKDGDPGTISKSRYMAGFVHQDGSKNTTYYKYSFPLTNYGSNCGAKTKPWNNSTYNNTVGDLKQQKFNTSCRASDGRLIIPVGFEYIVARFNASGNASDDWYFYHLYFYLQAVDNTAPSLLSGAISLSPGRHSKGNTFYVSVAFNEIVNVTGTPTLSTNWGTASYISGSGSNVLTFSGTISSSASGALSITGKSGTIKDLSGNSFSGSISKTFSGASNSVDESYAYPITYTLNGGTHASGYPTFYTYDAATTLKNPTRTGYTFAGWTGSNGSTKQTSVTIAAGSTGEKSYTANWTANTYTVMFNKQSGTGGSVSVTATYGSAMPSATMPTRAHYTFGGYYTSTGGSGTQYYTSAGASARNWDKTSTTTLYAKWTAAPTATVTAPTAKSLTYTGSAQALVNAGSASGGTLQYKLDSGSWGTSIPTATSAGTYTVYYRVVADDSHTDNAGSSVSVTIRKAALTCTADNKSVTYGANPPTYTATYSGWKNGETTSVLSGTLSFACTYAKNSNAGSYTITPSGVTATNYSITFNSGTLTVNKAASSITSAPTAKSLVYNGTSQTLVNAGTASGGTMNYSLNNSTWSSSLPSATTAGTYTVYYKVVGDGNHNNTSVSSITVYIDYTISYTLGGGSVASANPTRYNVTTNSFTLNNPTKTGYTFAGWMGTGLASATTTVTIAKGSTGNRSYTATWTRNEVTLTDGEGVTALSAFAGLECYVTYLRLFTKGKPSTVCLPFAYTKKVGDGSFYAFTDIKKVGSDYIATMTEPGTTTLTANTPYLYMPSTTGNVDFSGTYTIPSDLTAGLTTSGDWTFLGTYETVSWTEAPTGIYGFSAQNVDAQGISQGEFVKVGAYVRVKPLRCYLKYKNGSEDYAGARMMNRTTDDNQLPKSIKVRLIGANGEVTAIGTLHTQTGEVVLDGWYTLDGTRLSGKPTRKGIYVNNGRKVVIK